MDRLEQLTSAVSADETVLLKVTNSATSFKLPKSLLCDTCAYFRAALEGEFEEASTKQICLPGTDEETAKLLVFWLFQRAMPKFANEVTAMAIAEQEPAACRRLILLAHAWMLGDQIDVPKFQNVAMEMVLIMKIHYIPFDALESIYRLAPAHSVLSDLWVLTARFKYFNWETLEDAQLEELASIPGFLTRFMRPVQQLCFHFTEDHADFEQPWDRTWNVACEE